MHPAQMPHVAIIGGGFCAASLAIQLARRGDLSTMALTVIEPAARLGSCGIEEAQLSEVAGRTRHLRATATDASRLADGWELTLDSQDRFTANFVVLATGNPPPAHPPAISVAVRSDRRYVADPRRAGALVGVGEADTVLVLGAGPLALDVLLTLLRQGHRARVVLLSPHGLLPLADAEARFAPVPLPSAPAGADLLTWLRIVRTAAHAAQARGQPWQAVIDAVGRALPEVWVGLDERDREQFLRHLRPLWERHDRRARMADLRQVESLRAFGSLDVQAGSLVDARASADGLAVSVQRRGRTFNETSTFDHVVNAEESDLTLAPPSGLHRSLLSRGYVRQDGQLPGLLTDSAGAAIGQDGLPTPGLFAIGGARRPPPWGQATAWELRVQAEALTAALAEHLRSRERLTA